MKKSAACFRIIDHIVFLDIFINHIISGGLLIEKRLYFHINYLSFLINMSISNISTLQKITAANIHEYATRE